MPNPRVDIDLNKLKEFMRLKPTSADAAAFFDVSRSALERLIRDKFDQTFSEFREAHMVHTRMNLVRRAIELGMNGNVTMLIFCLKNLCDWGDRDREKAQDKPGEANEAVKTAIQEFTQAIKVARNERKK